MILYRKWDTAAAVLITLDEALANAIRRKIPEFPPRNENEKNIFR